MNLRTLAFAGALTALPLGNAFAVSTIWTVSGTGEPATITSAACTGNSCPTLRDAFNSAHAGDTITFANAINGATIALTLSSNDTTVDSTEFGPSAFFLYNRSLTIDGSGHGISIARDTAQAPFRLFDIDATSSLTLKGLTLRNGSARGGSSFGGGGALGAGGAIFNQGTLVIANCTLTQNAAQGGSGDVGTGSASGGAGVGADVAGEDGGGPNGAAAGSPPRNAGFGGGGGTAKGSNEDGGNGGFGGGGGTGSGTGVGGGGGFGGFGAGGGGNAYVKGIGGFGGGQSGGDIDHPPAGGGGAGMGGAIFNDAGSVTLTNVTFYKNTATGGNTAYAALLNGAGGNGSGYGGAIFNYAGSLSLGFVTLSANITATGTGGVGGSADGGAIYSYGDSNCGINDGNLCAGGAATLALLNSIAAHSTGAVNDIVVDATKGSSSVDAASSGNLVMTSSGVPSLAIVSHVDPKLGSPSPYAPTLAPATLPIAQTSPAYNAATSCAVDNKGTLAVTDERGVSRPQLTSTSACDIGAYEYDGDYIFANGFD